MRSWLVIVVALLAALGSCARRTAAAPLPAADIVTNAVRTAEGGHKVVLVEFGASWCVWCNRFAEFVQAPATAPVMASNFVIANITVRESDAKKALENPGGEQMLEEWGGEKAGLPFYVFLDDRGHKLADSNAMPDGSNIGFPDNDNETEAFVGLLSRTAPHFDDADRAAVTAYLSHHGA